MMTGMAMNLGPCAVLDVGPALVIVCTNPLEPFDVDFYDVLGIDPTEHRVLLIKSRQHFRAVFEPIAQEIIGVAGPGVCSEDYSEVEFKRIRRPMYPMDLDAENRHRELTQGEQTQTSDRFETTPLEKQYLTVNGKQMAFHGHARRPFSCLPP